MSIHDLIRNILKLLITELLPFEEFDERRYSIFKLRRELMTLFEKDFVIHDPIIKSVLSTKDEIHIEVSYTADNELFSLDIFQSGRDVSVFMKSAATI